MSSLTNSLPEQIRHQLARTLGIIELSLAQEEKLCRSELLYLRTEILKLYGLLREYSEIPAEEEGIEGVSPIGYDKS